MCITLVNSFNPSNALFAQRIQFEPDTPIEPVEDVDTVVAPPTSCELFGNFVTDAIGSLSPHINNLGGPLDSASELLQGMASNVISNRDIHIKGTFTIDVPIIFRNCKVKIEPDGEIIVKSRFSSFLSHYFACKGLWKGIKVIDSGTLFLGNLVSIEDAITAIDVTEKCNLLAISNTTFNRNMQGIFLHSTTTSPSTIIFNYFYKNKFTCTSELNAGAGWTRRGIFASSVNVPNLGQVPFPPAPAKDYANVFSGNIGVGIHSSKSLLNINCCRFANIDKSDSNFSYGIRAHDSNITLTGLGTPYLDLSGIGTSVPNNVPEDETTFYNCRNGGIFTTSSHLSVKKSFFYFKSDLSKNIKSIINCLNNPYGERIDIRDNHFYVNESEVDINYIDISRSSSQLNIVGNELDGQFGKNADKTRIGIHILSGHSSAISQSAVLIKQNLISIQSLNDANGKAEGIKLEGGSQYSILNNRIPSHGNKINFGIHAIDIRPYSEIKNNYIQFANVGIRLFSSLLQFKSPSFKSAQDAIFVCDNELEGCNNGTQFIGGHTIVLADNHYYDNKKALVLEDGPVFNARIGIQWKNSLYRKNYFEIDAGSTNPDNNTAEMPSTSDPELSQFAVDTRNKLLSTITGREYSKVTFENIIPNAFRTTWFTNQTNLTDVHCTIIPTAAAAVWEDLDDAILAGTYSNQSLALQQEADSYLFDKLSNYPELMEGNPERQAFFNEKQNTNIPIFNRLRKAIDNVFEYSPTQQTQMNSLQEALYSQKEHWIALAEEYNAEFGENEWSDEAKNIMQGLSDNLSDIQGAIELLKSQIETTTNNHIEVLIALNGTITPQSAHEVLAKNANHYWLKMIITKNHLSDEELLGVREIAATCYKEAARAKYIAINILPSSQTEAYINTFCFMEGKTAYTPKTNSVTEVKIMPNPANEVLNIEIGNNLLNPYSELSLVDISGRIIKKIENTGENNSFAIQTQDLNNGIYFLHFKRKDNSIKVHKVVILH